jgi:hypothetical protein
LVHYYYSQVAFQLGNGRWDKLFPGSTDDERLTWTGYRRARFDFLQKTQETDGSWKSSGFGPGPVFTTAMDLIILQRDNTYIPLSR